MKAIQGYHLIKPEDLSWRPSNLMKIPNADYLERTESHNLSARLWRLPPKEREHVAQAYPCGGVLFRAGRCGPAARGRRNVDGAEIRWRARRTGTAAPGIQRHRRRRALADCGGAGGIGISAWCKDQARHVADLSG